MRTSLYMFLAVVIAVVCSCSSEEKQTGKSGKFTLVYTGNIGARYDPCGCRIPLGGLARRSTKIKEIREANEHVIVVDTGALLNEKHRLYPPYEMTSRMRARLVNNMMDRIGIDAVNVSSMDLSVGADTLKAFDESVSFPWLSANIVWKDSGEKLFKSNFTKSAGDLTIGVFGIMDQTSLGTPLLGPDSPLEVLDPVTVATEQANELSDADYVIMLAYMDQKRVEAFAGQIEGVDLIVYGHTREHNPSSDHTFFIPYKQGSTLIARCPDGGRVIGVMNIEITDGVTDLVKADEIADLRPASVREAKPIERGSNYQNEFIDLGPDIKRDREMQIYLDEQGKQIEQLRDELRKKSHN